MWDPLHLAPVIYGGYMATADTFGLSVVKAIHLGWLHKCFIVLPTLIYAIQPWIFLSAMKFETLTVMNLLLDVLSDVFVTLTGLFFFKEQVSRTKMLGVALSFVSVFLLTWTGPDLV